MSEIEFANGDVYTPVGTGDKYTRRSNGYWYDQNDVRQGDNADAFEWVQMGLGTIERPAAKLVTRTVWTWEAATEEKDAPEEDSGEEDRVAWSYNGVQTVRFKAGDVYYSNVSARSATRHGGGRWFSSNLTFASDEDVVDCHDCGYVLSQQGLLLLGTPSVFHQGDHYTRRTITYERDNWGRWSSVSYPDDVLSDDEVRGELRKGYQVGGGFLGTRLVKGQRW